MIETLTPLAKVNYLIRNATILDGTGNQAYVADVAISNQHITAMGKLADQQTNQIIDAKNLALAPGFIDVHAHDDFAVLLQPTMDFKVMQGVTTNVVGNCGLGVAPYAAALPLAEMMHSTLHLSAWEGYAGYMQRVAENPPSLNVAFLAGHNTIRAAVMGNAQRQATTDEIKKMRALLQEALAAGVVGFSSGLIYEPGRYAATQELIDLAELMSGSNALYTTHLRNEADQLLEAIQEAITIGEQAKVAVQISHHKAAGERNWGRVKDSLKLIEQARARGVDVTADQYPYTSASTYLADVLENGALNLQTAHQSGLGYIAAENTLIVTTPNQPELVGLNLQTLCERWQVDAETAAKKILAKDKACVVLKIMNEADVCTVLQHATTMIGSDGIPTDTGNPHPRLYGSFARVLGHYVRDKKLLSLEQAIHKMTGLPANKFKLAKRGLIKPGYFADLVLFDPTTIADVATFTDSRQHPRGISHVFVNGKPVVKEGRHTQARPGQVLHRA